MPLTSTSCNVMAETQQVIKYQLTDTYSVARIRTTTSDDGIQTVDNVTLTREEIIGDLPS